MDSILPPKLHLIGELYRYWQALALEGFSPHPDPVRDLPHLAPNLMMIDVMAPGFRYHHFGDAIAAKLNGSQTGRPIGGSQLIEQVKLGWQQLLTSVARRRTPRLVRIEGQAQSFNYVLALPLNHAASPTKCILAGVFFDNPSSERIVIRSWRRLDPKTL